ncbi:unnamed protein product [Heligmosomoides polygyrus]|uniref:Uncharacterized protein n=1 Tax=Heligmosomoides polygyrus TaxID=6339 RepID=A0A183GQF7_HELPZ|nr:unnamed protein product [Heligmosomoides polygyrus]
MVRSRRRAERQIRFLSLLLIFLCCIWFALVLLQIALKQSTSTSPNSHTDDSSTISKIKIEDELMENLSVLDRRSDSEIRVRATRFVRLEKLEDLS